MAPGSNSIVVTAAVEPTTKTVAMPARQFDSATAAATRSVMSCASPCPFVATSRRWVATIGGGRISVSRLAGVAQLVEQLIRNQQVTRSSRVAGSKFPNDLAICASIVGLDPAARNYFVTTRSYFGYRDALQHHWTRRRRIQKPSRGRAVLP